MSAHSEPLPWPFIPGSPQDVLHAKIEFFLAHMAWSSSMTSELFHGKVTFSTEDYLAASAEYSAANVRARDRRERLAAALPRLEFGASSGAAHELEFYGGER